MHDQARVHARGRGHGPDGGPLVPGGAARKINFGIRQLEWEIRGVPVARRMPEHAVRAICAESREVPLWDRLTELQCPTLVIRGDRRSSVVTDELAERWRTSLPSVEIATIAGAGHDLWSYDVGAYLAALHPFLERIGAG